MKRLLLLFLVVFSLFSLGCKKEEIPLSPEERIEGLNNLFYSVEDAHIDKASHTWSGVIVIENKAKYDFVDCTLGIGNYLYMENGWQLTWGSDTVRGKTFNISSGETITFPVKFPISEYDSWNIWFPDEKYMDIHGEGYLQTNKPENKWEFYGATFLDGTCCTPLSGFPVKEEFTPLD